MQAAQAVLGEFATEDADIGLAVFSALDRTGLDDVALAVREWVQAAPVLPAVEVPPLAGADPDASTGEPT